MTKTMRCKEAAAVAAVLLVLISLPMTLWAWHKHMLRQPKNGSKVIMLTAVADKGIWTQDEVVGWNYWWKQPRRIDDLPLQQGDHVALYLRSVDVLHSFAIPAMHLGPIEIPSGHTVKLEFDATRPGVLTFLCWQLCSPDHQKLHGRFVVAGTTNDSW